MPQPSDDLAHEWLALIVDAGGSWDIGLSSTVPSVVSGAYTGVTDITEVSHATIARDSAAWGTPTSRSVIPVDDVELGVPTGDAVAVAWVLYDGADVVWAARVTSGTISGDDTDPVILPKEAVRLTVP